MKKSFISKVSIVIFVTALFVSACGSARPEAVNPPLRIAVNLWPGLYPAAIAQEQGIFAKHGVDVEIVYYESYPQTYADLVVGKVHGVSAIVGDMLLINNQTKL